MTGQERQAENGNGQSVIVPERARMERSERREGSGRVKERRTERRMGEKLLPAAQKVLNENSKKNSKKLLIIAFSRLSALKCVCLLIFHLIYRVNVFSFA